MLYVHACICCWVCAIVVLASCDKEVECLFVFYLCARVLLRTHSSCEYPAAIMRTPLLSLLFQHASLVTLFFWAASCMRVCVRVLKCLQQLYIAECYCHLLLLPLLLLLLFRSTFYFIFIFWAYERMSRLPLFALSVACIFSCQFCRAFIRPV